MSRPAHLADFASPPLNEVVIGVQFAPIERFTAVDVGMVFSLFKEKFPYVYEHPRLPPSFETFGGGNVEPTFEVRLGPPSVGSRLWFLSGDESSLFQFQSDRLLLNWRKGSPADEYPRFESILPTFMKGLRDLMDLSREVFNQQLDINQAELSYLNAISVESFSDFSWLRCVRPQFDVESLNANFSEVVRERDGGEPSARFLHTIQAAFGPESQRLYTLNLTIRGRPLAATGEGVENFILMAREKIVNRFVELTTSEAHTAWGRSQ